MSNISVWLTPIWLIACGTTIGSIILLALWGVVSLVNRKLGRTIFNTVRESILLPISYALVALAMLAVFASPVMPLERMWASLSRIADVGEQIFTVEVPAEKMDYEVSLPIRVNELRSYSFESTEDIAVHVEPEKGFTEPLMIVEGSSGELFKWTPGSSIKRAFEDDFDTLYLSNESGIASEVIGTFVSDVEMPEVHDLVVSAGGVIGIFAVYFLLSFIAPRVSIVATATAKEAVSQPIYLLLLGVGVVALLAFVIIPYHTFGEDVKMLMTTGMVTIKILAIIVALWTASVSVSDEIEGRTALTVLSKPVGRPQFILGKFLGIAWPILLMFIVLGLVFLFSVSIKVVYDARESSRMTPEWQECYAEVVRIVPGLVLGLFEAIVIAAISVAISTRVTMLPNLVICGSIYVLGHLGPLIVNSAALEGRLVLVKFVGQFIATLVPVLDHYEIEGAIAGAEAVPTEYLLYALFYSLCYCAAAMLLALFFFEDRDLA